MEHVQLGRTGLRVSRLCLGTMTFGLQCDEETSRKILDRSADGGITFIDTADVYPIGGKGEEVGRTEEIVGRWLAGKRDDFVLATKCGAPMSRRPWDRGGSRKHIVDAVDASLRRLQTDHIDLYQLHFDDRHTPLDETLEAFDQVVRAGKVRYVGCSNYSAWRLALAVGRSTTLGVARYDCVQPRYNLLHRAFERDLFELCEHEGIGMIPYNPLAGGFLTGKHRRQSGPSEGTRFSLGTAAERYQGRYWHDHMFDTVDQLQNLADEAGMKLATLAVAWCLSHGVITAPIVGASKPEQLDDALAATETTLDLGLYANIDELTRPYRQVEAEG